MKILGINPSITPEERGSQVEKLTGEEKIISLANKLIKAINQQGLSVMDPNICKGFGAFTIWIHDYGADNECVRVEKICKNGGDLFKFSGFPVKKIK